MNTGNKGKFSERIKRILYFKRNRISDENEIKRDNKKTFLLLPLMFIDKVIHQNRINVSNKSKDTVKKDSVSLNDEKVKLIIDIKDDNQKEIVDLKKKNSIKKTPIKRVKVVKIKNNEKINKQNVFLSGISILGNNIKSKSQNGVVKSQNRDSYLQQYNNSISLEKRRVETGLKQKERSNFLSLDDNNLTKNYVYSKDNVNDFKKDDKVSKIDELSSKIISDISKYLVKNINSLELIESDLYVLSKFDGNNESLEKCREYIIKLNALQNKLNKIRKQFDIFKNNTDFDNILDIDDKALLDGIIEFRDSISNEVANQTTKNYKLLSEYKYLYSRIDKVVNQVNTLEEEVNSRKIDLEKANIDFLEYQNKIYNFDKVTEESDKILKKQDEILKRIKDKISDISITKKVDYIYKGFLDLFFNSVKLMGLYMLTPLRKTIPGIAALTVGTKKNISNLIDSLDVEKRTRLIYSATDYSILLSSSINDLSSLDGLINGTLSDIRIVKKEFISKFSSYSKELSKYNSVLKKINRMEKEMINNSIKVKILEEQMREKKRKNEQVLVKVRKLNNN